MPKSWLFAVVVTLLAAACADSKSTPKADEQDGAAESVADASAPDAGDSTAADAETQSALSRPKLERPPTKGLPADMRPPR